MIRFYPESTLTQLEFDKVEALLTNFCNTDYGKQKASALRIHTHIDFIQLQLQQANESKLLLQSGLSIPGDFSHSMDKELKLLGIPGAVLQAEDFSQLRRLCDAAQNIFRWFDAEKRIAYAAMSKVVEEAYYDKTIRVLMDEKLDENGQVKDNASEELQKIRVSLHRKRNELRRLFDRIVQKMNKNGYLADIEESFLNGRRVLAVYAENKRMISGVLHGESDSRQTAFIEPEETTGLNNDIYSLENDERKEIYRILRELTARLQPFAPLLKTYISIIGEIDFCRAKAKLAVQMNANYPLVVNKAHIHLIQAYHPLLYIYNKQNGKPIVPVNIKLDDKDRILVISGPNAGGKTVAMKTIGLNQLMLQSGLLVPVSPDSEMGIFKQLFIHIGDTQSIEFELSTYSSHLQHMKHFIEVANGKTLFFIDELGSGSDPNLGGSFAEVIMEELAKKHSFGIVTTHYLNLKVMANRVPGIINGAMQFDEERLLPMYRLIVGKPGSSYTFSIAERIGLPRHLIDRARGLVDNDHFKLDKLLNRTEQDLQELEAREKVLNKLMKENEKLKKELEHVLQKEKHNQQVEILQHQNKIREEQLVYLKDMDRKLKALVMEWRRADDKNEVIKSINNLLSQQREKQVEQKQQKKIDKRFIELDDEVKEGDKVRMLKNRQVGIVKQIRGKKAIVQVGAIPITVDMTELVKVVEKVMED